jgi:NADH-quinone oxidoreductase subunit L
MEPAFAHAHHALGEVFTAPLPGHGVELGLMGLSVLVAAAGILVATRFYRGAFETPSGLAASFPGVYRALVNKYWVDELYGAVFVRGLALGGGKALLANDRFVIDGGDGEVRMGLGVNGAAWWVRDVFARLSNFWDRWVVDGAVNLAAFVLDNLSYAFRAVQNGLVQHYALGMLIGIFLLIAAGRFLLGLY